MTAMKAYSLESDVHNLLSTITYCPFIRHCPFVTLLPLIMRVMRPRIKHCTVWVRRVIAWITDNCAVSVGRLVSLVWLPRWWFNIWFSISLRRRMLFWFWGDLVRVWVITWNWHSHFVMRWYYVLSYQQRPRGQLNRLELNQVVLKLECSQVSLCWKVGSMVIDNCSGWHIALNAIYSATNDFHNSEWSLPGSM